MELVKAGSSVVGVMGVNAGLEGATGIVRQVAASVPMRGVEEAVMPVESLTAGGTPVTQLVGRVGKALWGEDTIASRAKI